MIESSTPIKKDLYLEYIEKAIEETPGLLLGNEKTKIEKAINSLQKAVNLDNQEEQLLAFNWRNTMPLSSKENLSKNNSN